MANPKAILKKTSGEWRWTITKGNKIVGASTEGYQRRRYAIMNYDTVVDRTRIPLWEDLGDRLVTVTDQYK